MVAAVHDAVPKSSVRKRQACKKFYILISISLAALRLQQVILWSCFMSMPAEVLWVLGNSSEKHSDWQLPDDHQGLGHRLVG